MGPVALPPVIYGDPGPGNPSAVAVERLIEAGECAVLTDPFPVFDFDFLSLPGTEGRTAAMPGVPVIRSGTAHAVVFWWECDVNAARTTPPGATGRTGEDEELEEGEENILTNAPGVASKGRDHWRQACCFLPRPAVHVKRGGEVAVTARHNDEDIWFRVSQPSPRQSRGKKQPGPRGAEKGAEKGDTGKGGTGKGKQKKQLGKGNGTGKGKGHGKEGRRYRCVYTGGVGFRSSKDVDDVHAGGGAVNCNEVVEADDDGNGWLTVSDVFGCQQLYLQAHHPAVGALFVRTRKEVTNAGKGKGKSAGKGKEMHGTGKGSKSAGKSVGKSQGKGKGEGEGETKGGDGGGNDGGGEGNGGVGGGVGVGSTSSSIVVGSGPMPESITGIHTVWDWNRLGMLNEERGIRRMQHQVNAAVDAAAAAAAAAAAMGITTGATTTMKKKKRKKEEKTEKTTMPVVVVLGDGPLLPVLSAQHSGVDAVAVISIPNTSTEPAQAIMQAIAEENGVAHRIAMLEEEGEDEEEEEQRTMK